MIRAFVPAPAQQAADCRAQECYGSFPGLAPTAGNSHPGLTLDL
jgi:hypothetical protein